MSDAISGEPTKKRATIGITLAFGWAAAAAALGGAPGIAPQEQVNQTETAYQGQPDVATLVDGGFVVVWRTNGEYVWIRAYDASGAPTTDETQLSEDVAGNQPRVARLTDDRLIVVWDDYVQGDVKGRFVTPDGGPTGPVFDINDGSTGSQRYPDVAASPDGGFVVVWDSESSGGDDASGDSIQMRRFDASGAPLGGDQQVNTVTADDQRYPNLGALEDGGFVVVWESNSSAGDDGEASSIQMRRIAANGSLVGSDQQVNSFVEGYQQTPDVASLPGGGFAIVWSSYPGALSEDPVGILVRAFGADGSPTGPDEKIDAPGGEGTYPALNRGPEGLLVAAWKEVEILGRLLVPEPLAPAGDVFRISDYDANANPYYSRVACDERAQMIVAWESYGSPGDDESDGSVQARRLSLGRVAHWQLDEGAGTTAGESTGQVDDDGTISSASNWTLGRPGGHRALAFDGDDRVDVPSAVTSVDLDIADGGVSIVAWVFLETLPGESPGAFQSIYDAAQDNYVLYLDRGAAELRFKVTDEDGTFERPGIPESLLRRHRWTHVAGVYEAEASAARIYLDGELIDTHVNAGLDDPVRTSPAQVAAIGRDGANLLYGFLGRIEQVEIWRKSLSQPEIEHLMGGWVFGDGLEGGDLEAWSATTP